MTKVGVPWITQFVAGVSLYPDPESYGGQARPVIARLYQGNLHNYWNLNCNEDTKTGPSPGLDSVS